MDLNRVGGEAEFTNRNEKGFWFANHGMKVNVHYRFSTCSVYCGRLESFLGGFSVVSEFNLARIALGLTMPTILARTAPLKK